MKLKKTIHFKPRVLHFKSQNVLSMKYVFLEEIRRHIFSDLVKFVTKFDT